MQVLSGLILLAVALALAEAARRAHAAPTRRRTRPPFLEALEGRDVPSGLSVDVVYAGAPVGSDNALIASSPYGQIASTVSIAAPASGSDADIQNALKQGLINGSIPWQGPETVIVCVLPPGMAAQYGMANGTPTTYRSVL